VEEIYETDLSYVLGDVSEYRERDYAAAFVRVFDGERWFYEGLTEVGRVQEALNRLAALARSNSAIERNPVVRALEVNEGEARTFAEDDLARVPLAEKNTLLRGLFSALEGRPMIKSWNALYLDRRELKHFRSSLGSDLHFDSQRCGVVLRAQMAVDDKTHVDRFSHAAVRFSDLHGLEERAAAEFDRAEVYARQAEPVEAGEMPVVLSPEAAGVFAHECFGHKSEADFMLGDESAKREWAIGTQVGAEILSIVDDGAMMGSGYVPYDDEGTRTRRTELIRNGKLAGRLHSALTAAALGEGVTGNARAVGYSFEPIPRMTTTSIGAGDLTKEELFGKVERGVFVDTINHGSGMSTFTLAPNRAYLIEDGRVTRPIKVAVVTGRVFQALGDVIGLSDQVELLSFVGGGCGKMEQMGLPVGFGGPHVLVKSLDVR
jgi:TldD protein